MNPREQVEAALDKIRPHLEADGGNAELIEIKDGVVTLRLTGACGSCPMSILTLRSGIEKVLKKEVPWVKQVNAV